MTQILHPLPPYDFFLSTFIFSFGDPEIQRSDRRKFWQVIRIAGKLVLAEATFSGTIEEPVLETRFRGSTSISSEDENEAGRIVARILNLDDDLTPFYQSVMDDLPMYALVQRLRGLKAPTTPSLFEALVDSIIEQQISLNVARALESRLVKLFGDTLVIDDRTYYAFPTPEALALGTAENFRACGLSARKGEYIRNAAGKFVEGEIDSTKFSNLKDSESIIDELCKLRGVGRWTAELAILRGLHRVDAVPADDLGIRRAVSQRYRDGRKINGEETRNIAERWGEYKGLACFYLLIADQMGI